MNLSNPIRSTITVVHEYSNGAEWTITNGNTVHIKYNTGDQVRFDINGNVVEIMTYDGLHKKY